LTGTSSTAFFFLFFFFLSDLEVFTFSSSSVAFDFKLRQTDEYHTQNGNIVNYAANTYVLPIEPPRKLLPINHPLGPCNLEAVRILLDAGSVASTVLAFATTARKIEAAVNLIFDRVSHKKYPGY
jgi:hypothetical protein